MATSNRSVADRVEASKGTPPGETRLLRIMDHPVGGYRVEPDEHDGDPIHVGAVRINGAVVTIHGYSWFECHDYRYNEDLDALELVIDEVEGITDLYPEIDDEQDDH